MSLFDDTSDDGLLKTAREIAKAIPHSAALGMTVHEVSGGEALMSVPYDEALIGDPETRVLHGGVITALLDGCCGTAVMTHPKSPGGTATIDLRIDYMRPATPDQPIFARAICHRVTRTVAFVRATAWNTDEADPVATAAGAFTLDTPGTRIDVMDGAT